MGDCDVPPSRDGIKISCMVSFYGRLDLLSGVLYCLAEQDFPKELLEVILVEDRGGTDKGRAIAEKFSEKLQIVYAPLGEKSGHMGYSRNYGLLKSRGQYALFLDDDTIILQNDFLKRLVELLESNPHADALIPHGAASFALIKGKYDYHDPYFMTNRCMAYKREVLMELGGFISDFTGQEDVEFAIRFALAGKKAIRTSQLSYMHPPLIVDSLNKPKAVGASFFKLKQRYSLLIWLLALLNGCRWIPLIFSSSFKHRMQGKFGLGFGIGVFGKGDNYT